MRRIRRLTAIRESRSAAGSAFGHAVPAVSSGVERRRQVLAVLDGQSSVASERCDQQQDPENSCHRSTPVSLSWTLSESERRNYSDYLASICGKTRKWLSRFRGSWAPRRPPWSGLQT